MGGVDREGRVAFGCKNQEESQLAEENGSRKARIPTSQNRDMGYPAIRLLMSALASFRGMLLGL
jgi:hypothetical protein